MAITNGSTLTWCSVCCKVWRVAFGNKEDGAERYVVTLQPLTLAELEADSFGTVVYKKIQEVPNVSPPPQGLTALLP